MTQATQTPQLDRPVLTWWPELLQALGSRYTHDPTRGVDDLHNPLKNPEGNVAGWGLTDGGTGRLFLLRTDGIHINVLAARGVIVIRSPAEGEYIVEELTTASGAASHRICKSPAEAVEAIDRYVAESR